jgi:hypothetical protein
MMTAGLPLAIELAASWLKGLRAAHIVQAMQRNSISRRLIVGLISPQRG